MAHRKWTILPLVYLFLLALVASPLQAEPLANATRIAPNWTLTDDNGNEINFYDDAYGQPTVLLFWATWCPYCRALMPHLEKVRRDYSDRGVVFYALNIWEDADPVAYNKEKKLGFRLMLDADEIAKAYGIKGTPGLLAVDGERNIIYARKSGGSPQQVESELTEVLEKLLKSTDA